MCVFLYVSLSHKSREQGFKSPPKSIHAIGNNEITIQNFKVCFDSLILLLSLCYHELPNKRGNSYYTGFRKQRGQINLP